MPPVVASKFKARNNPFATVKLEALEYRFENDSWQSLITRLEKMDYVGAIIGPEGVGKTTLLLELKDRLNEKELRPKLLRLSGGKRFLPFSFWFVSNKNCDVILVDSAENLPFWQFQLLRLKCNLNSLGLIVTAHKEGLLPTLIQCRTSLDLLDELTQRLLGQKLERQQLSSVFAKSNGNVRLAFMQLYTDI